MSLKIRPEQINAFQPVADAGFVRRLSEYLRSTHSDVIVRVPSGAAPVSRVPSALLNKMVQTGVSRSRRYGLTWESTTAPFYVITIVPARNIAQHTCYQH